MLKEAKSPTVVQNEANIKIFCIKLNPFIFNKKNFPTCIVQNQTFISYFVFQMGYPCFEGQKRRFIPNKTSYNDMVLSIGHFYFNYILVHIDQTFNILQHEACLVMGIPWG